MEKDDIKPMNATVEKGVLHLPPEFPTEEGRLFLTRGINDTAALFTPGQWNIFMDKLQQIPEMNRKRQLQHFFIAYGSHVDVVDRKIELPTYFTQRFLKEGPARIVLEERGYYGILQEDE